MLTRSHADNRAMSSTYHLSVREIVSAPTYYRRNADVGPSEGQIGCWSSSYAMESQSPVEKNSFDNEVSNSRSSHRPDDSSHVAGDQRRSIASDRHDSCGQGEQPAYVEFETGDYTNQPGGSSQGRPIPSRNPYAYEARYQPLRPPHGNQLSMNSMLAHPANYHSSSQSHPGWAPHVAYGSQSGWSPQHAPSQTGWTPPYAHTPYVGQPNPPYHDGVAPQLHDHSPPYNGYAYAVNHYPVAGPQTYDSLAGYPRNEHHSPQEYAARYSPRWR
ncbi:hypothetical protein C8T65DRAFT_640216 [Cerioporus squamosus]|nr:hypothetical protein C8T65DRAFT_640216 [Cerioporus squamosus]